MAIGKLIDAKNLALEFPWLRHPELDRVRRIIRLLSDTEANGIPTIESAATFRESIHQLPEKSDVAWFESCVRIMLACGQPSLAKAIVSNSDAAPVPASFPNESRRLLDATQSNIAVDIPRSGTLERKLIYFRVLRNYEASTLNLIA